MTGTTSGDTSQGVSNLYVFKSRLQEFAQKVGLPTPTYETRKDGPSHEPTFQSTVVVKDVRYDSLPGFYNRKAAEQSAAEIALLALSESRNAAPFISQPAHETGLCKNLLQEYAQKMNHAIPLYECKRDATSGRIPMFSCTVEIGGMKYIGCAAKTKKEAEIKAARTAMLAIQATSSSSGSHLDGQSNLTVIPIKKKLPDSATPAKETKALKPRRRQFKKKPRNNNMNAADGGRNRHSKNMSQMQSLMGNEGSTELADANANADADANANANVSANVDAHVNVNANANVDANVNVNGNDNGIGNGNGNGNDNVDGNDNGNEVTPHNVYTLETPEDSGLQKRLMDAPYDPCSSTGSDVNGNGNGNGGNSSCSLSNDVNPLQTSTNMESRNCSAPCEDDA